MQLLNQIHVFGRKLHKGGAIVSIDLQKLENDSLIPPNWLIDGSPLAERLKDEPLQRCLPLSCFKQLTRLREIFGGTGYSIINREFFIRLFRTDFPGGEIAF